MKKLLIAPFAALLMFAGSAGAAPIQTLTLRHDAQVSGDQGLKDVVEVSAHRNIASVIATDALYGGIAGLAIGAGVALLEGSNNWGRDLSIGAGAGILIGGIFGAVDAARADRAYPVGESRDRGFSRALGTCARF